MATYQQLTRSSSSPALNVRLTGGLFGQHNDTEEVAADSNFGDEPDTSSLPTDRANAESTGSHNDSDHLASVMSEDQNPMASRNVSSMDPHWFEHLPQVARLDSQNSLQFYQTDTGFPSLVYSTPAPPIDVDDDSDDSGEDDSDDDERDDDDSDEDGWDEEEDDDSNRAEEEVIADDDGGPIDGQEVPPPVFDPYRPHYILPEAVLEEMFAYRMTMQSQVYLELASLLIQWKCPMYAFDSLLDWMHRGCQDGNFDTGGLTPQQRCAGAVTVVLGLSCFS
jgi:hypothetical protein